jgi:hypothetical protein
MYVTVFDQDGGFHEWPFKDSKNLSRHWGFLSRSAHLETKRILMEAESLHDDEQRVGGRGGAPHLTSLSSLVEEGFAQAVLRFECVFATPSPFSVVENEDTHILLRLLRQIKPFQ